MEKDRERERARSDTGRDKELRARGNRVRGWGRGTQSEGEAIADLSPGQFFRRQQEDVSWPKGLLCISFIGPACPVRENIQLL